MASCGVSFETQQRRGTLLSDRPQLSHLSKRLRQLELPCVNFNKSLVIIFACSFSPLGRRAQGLQTNVIDPSVAKACGEDVLGKAGPSRERNGTHVSQDLHPGGRQRSYYFE